MSVERNRRMPRASSDQVGGERDLAVDRLDRDAGARQLDGGAGDAHGGERVKDAQVAAVEAQLHRRLRRAPAAAPGTYHTRDRSCVSSPASDRLRRSAPASSPPRSDSVVPATRLPSAQLGDVDDAVAVAARLMSSVTSPMR